MSKGYLFFIIILLFCNLLQAQNFTISGVVTEENSKELLIGVNIYLPALKTGTITNSYGFYSITLPKGTYKIVYSFVGYKTLEKEVEFNANRQVNISLSPGQELQEVEVAAQQNRISREVQMSNITLPVRDIKMLPVFLGEKDVLRMIQLMPGVQKGSEGQTGIYVRGGGPDQNLMILDDAPVYNASHLFGFFSIFNGDALRNVELIKGGFPARYGGRLSSVIDMSMKDGNKSKYAGELGIGLIASRGVFEGPIVKNKSSFIISARRTYLDILLLPAMLKNSGGEAYGGYYFYDFNAKLNFDIDSCNKVFVSGYFGQDKFYMKQTDENIYTSIGWGNATGTVRWNHIFSPRLFSNLSFISSNYRFAIKGEEEDFYFKYYSGINDLGLKYDFYYQPSLEHTIRAGAHSTVHLFTPKAFVTKIEEHIDDFFNQKQRYNGFESALYAEDLYKPGSRLQINAGLRLTSYLMEKKADHAIEPRLAVSYMLTENLSVKASYARMKQYIHLLTNTGIGLPTDLWVPATELVPPEKSQIVAAGIAQDIAGGDYLLSVEGYYKTMDNVIQYKPGMSYFIEFDEDESGRQLNWQNMVCSGKAKSYGGEVFFQKKNGNFTGWIGYTLSWTPMHFDDINNGQTFWARYDRRHDASIVGIYRISEGFSLSFAWVYGTGNALTLQKSKVPVVNHIPLSGLNPYLFNYGYEYGGLNSFRAEAYHRLDLSLQFNKELKKGTRTIELSVYNAYNRKNPYFYGIEEKDGKNRLIRYSLFPVIPTLTYSFKFR